MPIVLKLTGPDAYLKTAPRYENCSPQDLDYTHQISQADGRVAAERYNANKVCNGVWGWYTGYSQPVSAILSCPDGYTPYTGQPTCDPTEEPILLKNLGACGAGQCCLGNPINPGNGNKIQKEVDYSSPQQAGVSFVRYYNSLDGKASSMGYSWRHTYSRSINYIKNTSLASAILYRPDGKGFPFTKVNGTWTSDSDVRGQLSAVLDGLGNITEWTYVTEADEAETYTANGQLSSIATRGGWAQQLSYDNDGRLKSVTDQYGRTLQFSYDAAWRVARVSDPAGAVYEYNYDDNNNLVTVVYPDATPANSADNPIRTYHYENADFPHALTGITDERGIRYATYGYDTDGRAKATYHAGNAQRLDIVYNADGTRSLTNSLGQSTTYTTAVQLGVALVTTVTGPGCATCGNGNTSYQYDPANNDLLSQSENGVTTQYGNYDTKGQFGYKTEGVGTAAPRRTDYTYDPRFHNTPTTITKPSVFSP